MKVNSNIIKGKLSIKIYIRVSDIREIFPYIYIYIYIYCHPQTDCFVESKLFSVARQAGCFKLGSKPTQFYFTLSIIPLSHQVIYISPVIYNALCINFRLFIFCLTGYQSAQFTRRALHSASVSRLFLLQGTQPLGRERIYCHPQTHCFVVLQPFRVARHAGRFKLGSKSAQLYDRRSSIPFGHFVIFYDYA